MEMAARDSNDHLVPRVHDRAFRRNKPAAIRFAGSRAGARRRIQHRIQLDEVRALFSRRIRRDDYRVRCRRYVIFWRLAFSGHTRWLPRMDLRPDQHRSLFHKGRRRDFLVYVGALDTPTISMGPADAAGLAVLFRNRVGEHFYRRGDSPFHDTVIFLFLSILIPGSNFFAMPFHHEKLTVYQRALEFAGWSQSLIDSLTKKTSTRDHLERSGDSNALNIAEENGKFSKKDRAHFFQIAHGSALESAACLDLLVVRRCCAPDGIIRGKAIL